MKENESKEDHENRQLVYELLGIRDESMHIKPYADMIDKLTYVQKADFAKRALELGGENRSLIDQINSLTYEKTELEMKLGAAESNLWSSEHKRKQAFELLTAIGNGQVPQAEIWQKINDIVNLPF